MTEIRISITVDADGENVTVVNNSVSPEEKKRQTEIAALESRLAELRGKS